VTIRDYLSTSTHHHIPTPILLSHSLPTLPTPLPLFFLPIPHPPTSTLFPYTTLFRSATVSMACAYEKPIATTRSEPLRARLRSKIGRDTSELQSPCNLVCRLLLEKKK